MSRNRRVFAFLLMVVAVIATGPVPTAFAGVAPPDGLIAFAIYAPGGTDVGAGLEGIVAVQPAGGDWWMGAAKRQVFAAILEAGFKPVFVVPGTEDRFGSRDAGDADADGLSDADEAIYNTDPMNPDSDQDFLSDGDEVHTYGTWPLRESTDGDRYDDGQEVLGFSPSGLGALGGDMPGYVLAPGDDPFVAAYPKIDFEVRDGIEMQANVETEIGSSTMTTETKTKSTTQRSVDITTYGEESNYIYGNQHVDNPAVIDAQQAAINSGIPTSLAQVNTPGAQKYIQSVTTGAPSYFELAPADVCGVNMSCETSAFDGLQDQATPMGTQSSGLYTVSGFSETKRFDRFPLLLEYGYREKASGRELDYFWNIQEINDLHIVSSLISRGIEAVPFGAPIRGAMDDIWNWATALGSDEPYGVNVLAQNVDWLRYEYLKFRTIGSGNPVLVTVYEIWDGGAITGIEYPNLMNDFMNLFDLGMPPPFVAIIETPGSWSEFVQFLGTEVTKSRSQGPVAVDSDTFLAAVGPYDAGARLGTKTSAIGSGFEETFTSDGIALQRKAILDAQDRPHFDNAFSNVTEIGANKNLALKADSDNGDSDGGEESRKISRSTTSLRETIVTETYSWSTTQEDWEATTTDSADFGTVTFSFNVRNTGTDMALDAAGLRFNLFIGDNPATAEVEAFNPITFPQIQDPAITFSNVGPGDELLFGATVHLQKQQFRALDEGASLKIAVADYSYGSDELYYRSAAGGGVRFLIDNGVLEPEATRYEEYLVPVQQVWDEDLGRLRAPTYGETLAQVVDVEHDDGVLRSINGRPITDSAWWSMMLTTPTDASLFYKSTAIEGQTVRMEYHGDADNDAYADAVELEHGTDVNDPEDHPAPVVIGALYEGPDPDNPGWTLGRFKVTNTGTYEAYGMEARIYATDDDIEITDALVGGSGLVNPGETWDHPDDTFRYRSSGGAKPLLEIRYNDPEGLHILLSTVTLATLDEDITGLADLMVEKQRITANAIETFFYDVEGRLTVGYANPTNRTIRDAWIVVDWQSLMGDILHHEARQLDLRSGDNFESFDFMPKDYLSPINIGGRFKALVRVMDHNGALIDSKVSYMTVWPESNALGGGQPAPKISISPPTLDLGTLESGKIYETSVVIANVGASGLDFLFSANSPYLRPCGAVNGVLSPGEHSAVCIQVVTRGLPRGQYTGTYAISSNDPGHPRVTGTITANIGEPISPVLVTDIAGRPWEKRLSISGNYPQGSTLVFPHGIENEPELVVPLLAYDGSRNSVIARGPDIDAVGYGLERHDATTDGISLLLSEPIFGGTEYLIQFGKKWQHQDAPNEGLIFHAKLPQELVGAASLEVWKDQVTPDYSNPTLWTFTRVSSGAQIFWLTPSCIGKYTYCLASEKTTFDFQDHEGQVFAVRGDMRVGSEGCASCYGRAGISVGSTVVFERSSTGPTENTSVDAVLEFDHENQLVRFIDHGTLQNTVDVSNEPHWKVTLFAETRGDGNEQTSTARFSIEKTWKRAESAEFGVDVGANGLTEWIANDAEQVGLPSQEGRWIVRSPDLASAINEALSAQSGGADYNLPFLFLPAYMGSTIVTDLNLVSSVHNLDVNLRVAAISPQSASLDYGESLPIEIVLENTGSEAAPLFTVALSLGNPVEGGEIGQIVPVYGGLPPGCSTTVSLEWNSWNHEGLNQIWIAADVGNQVVESSESDNADWVPVTVRTRPDLFVENLSINTPTSTVQAGKVWGMTCDIRNSGEDAAGNFAVTVYETFSGVSRLIRAANIMLEGQSTESFQWSWSPQGLGTADICVRIDEDNMIPESNESNNVACLSGIRVATATEFSQNIDAGASADLDAAFGNLRSFGYLNGTPLTTWGTLPYQSARYDLGGSVQYRFDYLDPTAMYHLDATFFEGDGIGRVMEIWVDGSDTGVSADLADGLIHRVSATLDPAAYGDDSSIVVDFRRQGPGDALVNEIRLVQVDHRGIDCGDDGTTDFLFDPEIGHGFLNGSADTSWGTESEHSVRYSASGELLYRFDGLEAAKNYKVSAVLYEGDGAGREEAIQIDGGVLGTPVLLSATPQTTVVFIDPSAYVDDGSVLVRISRTNGASSAVVSELVLEEDTLPRRTLSDATVTPDASDGSTVFSYQVTFTDLTGVMPDSVEVSVDSGAGQACVQADAVDVDSTDGLLFVCQASGLLDGLHEYSFSAVVAGEPAAGDVGSHTGPLVGGPSLPDAGEYGYIPAGDLAHDDQVIYAFGASSRTLRLGFELYDVDSDAEVEIWLNGELLAAAETTDDAQWSGPRDLLLPAAMLRDDTANHLVFRNTSNQPSGTEPWGVRQVSLLAERPEGLTVTDVPADDGDALLVQWQLSVDDNAGLDNVTEYRVYRADSAVGPWSQLAAVPAGETLWVDSGLSCEAEYWYQVEAWNGMQASAVNLRASAVPLDNVAPLIAGASPLEAAMGVPLSSSIVFHVSDSGQGVDHTTLQARIDGVYINPVLTGDPGFYTVTLNPSTPLPADSDVVVTLEAADLANPANAAETFTLSFHTVPDTAAPYVFAASPADGATGVDPDAVLSFHLRDDGLGVDQGSVTFSVNGITVPPTVKGEVNDLLFSYDPATSLTAGQTVTLTVSAVDLATPANSMSDSWSFTIATGDDGPVIVDFAPTAHQLVIDGASLGFTVTAQDDSLDVMTVDWSVDGTPGASGITLNGSGGGSWQARTPIVVSGGAADYTDETVTIQLGSHSTAPADYLLWDDFGSLDPGWLAENVTPTATGSLDLSTSGSELSAEVDTYAFVYQSQSFVGDWYAESKVTANNTADSDGAGLLARVNDDTWYFVGQVWDAGLAADAVALRFQTGAMSVVNLPVAEAAATVYVRLVKIGNLLHAAYRLNTASPWTELGYAPIIVDEIDLGFAAWDNSDTLNASFDDFRLNDAAHPPITTALTGATAGFADIRVTEDDGVSERLVPISLSDSDADEVADTLSFPADTTAPGVWKSYWVYSGNPNADAQAVEVLPGSDALAETAVFGVEAPVAAAGFNWSATPVGAHTVEAEVSDGTSSDFMNWQVEVVATSPEQPAGLTAVAGDSAVLLAWTLSDRANVAGYNVYRSGAGPINAEPLTVAAYADTGLVNGAEYCYTVRAVSPDVVEGPDSAVACATPHDQTVPSAPPLLTGVGLDQAVQLDWYAGWAVDLAGYNVYRRVSGVGDLGKINATPLATNSHLDTPLVNGTSYDYAVTTVDSSGNESLPSLVVTATPQLPKPAPPTALGGSEDQGIVSLSWNASAGPDVAGYKVYRSLVSGMLWEPLTPAPIVALSFDDDTGIEGLTYYYVASAVGTNGSESGVSNEFEITVNIDPGAPENLDAATGNRKVLLGWDPNTESDLAGYSVYRSATAGGPFTKMTTALLDDPSYEDADVAVDEIYYYVVTAVDQLKAESEYSNEAHAVPDRAHVIVVNDEGDAAYAEGVAIAVRDAGSFVDQWDVRLLGSPELSDLSDYDVAIWNLGPEYQNTISGEEQTTLIAFLEGGGSLAVFGQDLIYDLGVSNTLLNDYLHVVGATEDSCGQQVLGLVDDPISDAMALPLTTPFGNTCDVLTPDGSALTVFTNDLGEAVALRADDGIASHTFFAAFAFEGVSETDAAPNNRTTLIARLLAWFNEPLAHIFADGFESNDTSAWDAATP